MISNRKNQFQGKVVSGFFWERDCQLYIYSPANIQKYDIIILIMRRSAKICEVCVYVEKKAPEIRLRSNPKLKRRKSWNKNKYLEYLAELYPTIEKASTEIINLQSIINLPKGTEHFLSDIHGEYEAFSHV